MSKSKGAKKFLLSTGIQINEMRSYLVEFFESYGHQNVATKSLPELLELAGLYFVSLKKYAFKKEKLKKVCENLINKT